MEDCIFCRIAEGDSEANIVYENEDGLAFLDINPLTDGHTVVIPRNHYHKFSKIPTGELSGIFEIAQQVSDAIREGLDAGGCNIGINDGEVAGQAVPHTHVHLIPRRRGDGARSFHDMLDAETSEDLQTIQEKIKKAI